MAATSVNQRIATHVRELRESNKLSLEALAVRSGVSRSMISLIERGESSPTAVVLEKLASAFGKSLAALFDEPGAASRPAPGPLARLADQPEWQDPDSGYRRRNVSPSGTSQPAQIVEVHFPPGGRVAFDNHSRTAPMHQQVWVLEGTIEITVGKDRHRLLEGDCLAMTLDRPVVFHNPTRRTAWYAVVIAS